MKGYLQRIGRSLMLPVAVLPLAALMLGIGYWIDPAGWGGENVIAAFLVKAGGSILDNMGILFAVGVGIGMTKEKDGAAGLAALVSFLTMTTLLSSAAVAQLKSIPVEEVSASFAKVGNGNVFFGIIAGIIAAETFNKFHRTKLPEAFAFFSGRRLVPILTGIFSSFAALVLLFLWPLVFDGLTSFGEAISSMGWLGAGIYAFFNRLLIPTGLHHALNNVFWFDLIGINDIGKFWANEGTKGITGMYQAGFFPVFMFGLPAACYAMYRKAAPEYKKQVMSLFLAAGVAAFVTGVTEPIEFSFMFVAPVLYLVHAALTAVSVAFAALMHWTAGFAFSAGAIDFLLSLKVPMANHPWMLILQGLVVAVLYYLVFSFVIEKFDLATPGRKGPVGGADLTESNISEQSAGLADTKEARQASVILEAIGGKENVDVINNCSTRLRLQVKDSNLVDKEKIKAAGAMGINVIDKNNVQVIIGTTVQQVADAMEDLVKM